MAAPRTFVSFDYDNDVDLKNLFVGQARNSRTPFEIADWSIKSASPTWREDARRRIRASSIVIVICGSFTHMATGVSVELKIAQEENVPYFLLAGRTQGRSTKPTTARPTDKLYEWTWPNIEALLAGRR